MIYLVYFAASAYFAYLARKAEDKKRFFLYSVLSVLITVMLAGLRDYSIGTDVENYLNQRQFWASAIEAESVGEYLKFYFSLGLVEPLFALFLGSIAQLTGDFRLFLVLSHVVIVTCIYIGAFRLKHHARPELVLMLFYLLYYNNSLNLIRQYMAMALVFAFFADLEERKFIRYFVAVLIAALIHTTAIISLIPLTIYLILYPQKEMEAASAARTIFVCGIVLVGVFFFIPLIKLAIQWGFFPKKYQYYFQDKLSRLAMTRLLIRILEITGLILCYKKLRTHNNHLEFYLVNTVTFMALLEMSRRIAHGQRIPLHFAFTNIVTVSMLESCHEKKTERLVWTAMIVFLAAYYWYHTYVLGMGSETVPYKFGF